MEEERFGYTEEEYNNIRENVCLIVSGEYWENPKMRIRVVPFGWSEENSKKKDQIK